MAAPAPALDPGNDPSFAELLAQRPHLSRHAHDGLVMEDVPLARIAEVVGSPTWVYSAGTLRRRARALRTALADAGLTATVHFATKANLGHQSEVSTPANRAISLSLTETHDSVKIAVSRS